jgi:hypothetical protein
LPRLHGPKHIGLSQQADHFAGDHTLLFNLAGALPDCRQQRVYPDQESIRVSDGLIGSSQRGGHGGSLNLLPAAQVITTPALAVRSNVSGVVERSITVTRIIRSRFVVTGHRSRNAVMP